MSSCRPGCSSDRHAGAVEAREGEAVEGFAEGGALVAQQADRHRLTQRHRAGRVGPPVDARPVPAEAEVHRELVQLDSKRYIPPRGDLIGDVRRVAGDAAAAMQHNALFVGTRCIAVVEAKRQNKNVSAYIDQAQRYSRGFRFEGGAEAIAGPWVETDESSFLVPFV